VLDWFLLLAAVAIATRILATSGARAPQDHGFIHEDGPGKSAWIPKHAALAAGAMLAGFVLRLVGIGNSLSGDEFGTLWTVEEGLVSVVSRSISFHGQSPFYYLLVWPFVHWFGESEAMLRLPSVGFTLGAALLLYAAGSRLGGRRAGLSCGIIFWLSFLAVMLGGDARPYALSLFCASLAFYGFVRAVEDARPLGRCFFILGGVGLVASHYLVALVLAGLGIGYLTLAPLRRRYSPPKFFLDVGLQILLSLPFLSQVLALWGRRGELAWTGEVSFTTILYSIGPEILLLCGALAAMRLPRRGSREATWLAFTMIAALTPLAVMLLLAALGTNLFVYRYVAGVLVPGCLMAGLSVSGLPFRLNGFSWLGWAALHAAFLAGTFFQAGSFTGAGYQDWRGAVAALRQQLASNPAAAVLYRSGFVEDDLRVTETPVSPAVYSPLRSPGQPPPSLPLTPLTYNWDLEGREAFFERTIVPVIQSSATFYYFSCDCASDPRRAFYEQRLQEWVGRRFPGRFQAQALSAGAGMVLLRFSPAQEPLVPLR
jgi:hypothetical protein